LDERRHRATSEHGSDIAAHEADRRRSAPPIGNVHEVDAGLLLEEYHGQMMLAAIADRRVEQWRLCAARRGDEPAEVLDEGSAGLAASTSSLATRLATGTSSVSGSTGIFA